MIKNLQKESFNFKDTKLLKYLQCRKCNNIFRNPVRVHPCGHTFCSECSPRPGNACFNCITIVVVNQPDLISRNLIADLQVKCTAPGCPFRGTYEQYQSAHQQNCVIGRSGGLQNWMQNMKYAVDNIKYPAVKQPQVQNQNDQFSQLCENQEGEEQDDWPEFKKDKAVVRVEGKSIRKKNREDEKFIECIAVDGKKQPQIEVRQLDGVERFTQLYFNHPKPLLTNQKRNKNVINLL